MMSDAGFLTGGKCPRRDPTPNAIGGIQHSRRELLRWAALAAGAIGASELLGACGGGAASGGRQQAAAGSLRALVADVPQLSILGGSLTALKEDLVATTAHRPATPILAGTLHLRRPGR